MLVTLQEAMVLATDYAVSGVNNNIGGPFGAMILKKQHYCSEHLYEVVSLARNTVVSTLDPTNHAEMNAIRQACELLGTFDLSDCILITTGKSCPMCASAIMWANIKKVYYGTTYKDAELIGFRDKHIHDHLKGEIKLVEEIQFNRDYALNCHKAWADKNDRVLY